MRGNLLSPDLASELRRIATPILTAKGCTLFRAGQPVRGSFLVLRGRVRMSLGRSRLYPSRAVGAGNVIGLPATFSGEPYSLTAKAERDCRLAFIPRARLLDLLRRNPKVGFQIVRMLSEEIFQMRKDARIKPRRKTLPVRRPSRGPKSRFAQMTQSGD